MTSAASKRRRIRLHSTPGATRRVAGDVNQAKQRRRGRMPPLEAFSQAVARRTGSSFAFALALGVIVAWALTGPMFGFSDTWQLVVNTGTTIVTFLMVFLIQRAQNKDTHAMELKLDELIASIQGASNRLIDVEDLSEEELQRLQKRFRKLVSRSRRDGSSTAAHSVEETQRD